MSWSSSLGFEGIQAVLVMEAILSVEHSHLNPPHELKGCSRKQQPIWVGERWQPSVNDYAVKVFCDPLKYGANTETWFLDESIIFLFTELPSY